MKKSDTQIKQDIEDELRWEPMVNAAQIGVSVEKGVVSLVGAVDTYSQKWAAEEAVKRVSGVRVMAQDLTVKLLGEHKYSDTEVAAAVQRTIQWDVCIPKTVTVKVTDGQVTLEGQAEFNFEREAAERAVRHLIGVVSVNNLISLQPQPSNAQVKEKIQAALQRQATTDSSTIHVETHLETSGSKVTLSGTASSLQSSEDAVRAAWSAPGVTTVIDHMKISMTV
jgi:osmotically-inducible protein OsmY